VGDDLERLPETGALPLGERHLVVATLVVDPLSLPHLTADLDDLPGATHRSVVGHTVEPLDDLRPRGTEPEDAATVGHGVDPCRRHGQQGGGAGVDGKDAGGDLNAFGGGGEVAHETRCVEAVGLGHPDDVEARFLVLGHLAGRLLEPTAVLQLHAELHQ